jgi:uncharacterized protein YraI
MRKIFTFGLACVLLAIPFVASAQEAYTTRSVNIRGGPDTTYPPIAVLAPGAPVQVMGCLNDWSWCDVAFADNRGWIYAPYIDYVYQGARVPFYTYAPTFGIPIVAFSLGSYWDRYYRGRDFYGRRDYWERRAPPQHFRPTGPSPRAFSHNEFRAQDFRSHSGSPGFAGNRGDNRDLRTQDHRGPSSSPGFTGNRGDNRPSREVNVQSRDHRTPQAVPSGKPAPTVGRQPQEMRRASPTQPAGPAPASRAATPRVENHAPQGNAVRGNQHDGGKDKKDH